jgi:hypothetical protein
VNGPLTPLAVLGLILFAVLVVLLSILFFKEARGVWRLLRGGRVKVRLTGASTTLQAQTPSFEPDKEPQVLGGSQHETPSGWGFDRREQ